MTTSHSMMQTPQRQQRQMVQPGRGGPGMNVTIEKARDTRAALTRLAGYFASYKTGLIFVFILVTTYTLLGLVGPYLMGVAIDRFIIGKDAAGLVRTALLMLAAYVSSNLLQIGSNWLMANISQGALRNMRRDLFGRLQSLPLAFFDSHPAGELMSRLVNDIDAINQAVSLNVTALFASALSMVGILTAMFVLNHWLALATLVVIPVMAWFTQFVARYTRRGFRELQMRLGMLNGVMQETVSGQKVIKAFGRKDSAIATFREQNQAVYKAAVTANTYAMLLMPLTNVLGNFFVIVLAGFGGVLALQGLVSVGTIASFINYGQNFINPLRQIANMYNSVQAALAGAERVFEIIDSPGETPDTPKAVKLDTMRGDVCFDHVHFGYNPQIPVIKDLDLCAKSGQTIALVGPTGAGKTTVINLLTRFYDPQIGSIRIDGVDLRDMQRDDLRRQLGLVLQDTFLFADTVMENIRYGRLEATDEEVMEAARLAEADGFIRRLPQGYQTKLSERASNLSQGQRQQLAIARVILADPAVLILDEATSSVDTRTELRIQTALLRLMKGRTSFVIAHRLSTIRDADNVVVIDKGEIVEQGTHQQLLDKKGFYYNLYEAQYRGIEI